MPAKGPAGWFVSGAGWSLLIPPTASRPRTCLTGWLAASSPVRPSTVPSLNAETDRFAHQLMGRTKGPSVNVDHDCDCTCGGCPPSEAPASIDRHQPVPPRQNRSDWFANGGPALRGIAANFVAYGPALGPVECLQLPVPRCLTDLSRSPHRCPVRRNHGDARHQSASEWTNLATTWLSGQLAEPIGANNGYLARAEPQARPPTARRTGQHRWDNDRVERLLPVQIGR